MRINPFLIGLCGSIHDMSIQFHTYLLAIPYAADILVFDYIAINLL